MLSLQGDRIGLDTHSALTELRCFFAQTLRGRLFRDFPVLRKAVKGTKGSERGDIPPAPFSLFFSKKNE